MTTAERLALSAEQLRRHPTAKELPFENTSQVRCLSGTIGQPRAIKAIEFAMEIKSFGYNLYVAGPRGSGRETTVRAYVERFANQKHAPDDWVYVHNFDDADYPRALRLPPGMGGKFWHDMDDFIRSAKRQIPRAFDGDEYEHRKRDVMAKLTHHKSAILDELQGYARENNFTIELTASGFVTVPLQNGEPITNEDFDKLDQKIQHDMKLRNAKVQGKITSAVRELRQTEKETHDQIKQLDQDVAKFALTPLLEDLREKYRQYPGIITHLERVTNDILVHLSDFRPETEENKNTEDLRLLAGGGKFDDPMSRYRVNVLVGDNKHHGGPVIIERNPTYYNLVGRINYRASFGALATDFLQIKPGALHRANGGFLIINIMDLLKNPFVWDALKRALLSKEVQIENMGEQYTMLPTASLRPEPIPLDVKVILIGPPQLYHLLHSLDEEFESLFKIKADFSPDMAWNTESIHDYAAFISRAVREHSLPHFDSSAIARIVEYGARQVENQRKLSTRMVDIAGVIVEAGFWAQKARRHYVSSDDVDRATKEREYRSNMAEERMDELIDEGSLLIDTSGRKTGQVNGLAVITLGDHLFGMPNRITATAGVGRGTIVSVERETKLSGPIHSKGFLILSGYLTGKYASTTPLTLHATITFEQSYAEVEGDSASSTELYSLLSSIAEIPLQQNIAITGSVNQHGEIQPVGGVTQKIEGFFKICKKRGLDGKQGVIIPESNAHNLMLKDEVITAVKEKKFNIWAVKSIDEGLEILSGVNAAAFHNRVIMRLQQFAEQMRTISGQEEGPHLIPSIPKIA